MLPTSRSVAGIGIPEKWATTLAYAPYIGLVISLLELLLVPRKEKSSISRLTGFSSTDCFSDNSDVVLGNQYVSPAVGWLRLFGAGSFIFLLISMIRVWKGEPHRIAAIGEPAQWFNEHIEPRNQG